jgi:hypothetical protein
MTREHPPVSFVIFATLAIAAMAVVDPGITHTLAATLSAHPFEAALGVAVAIEPLAVPTRVAWHMMGISNAHGYKLVELGEIDSYLEGRVRKVTVASIKAYIARKLAEAKKDSAGPVRTEKATATSVARRAERKAAEGTRRGRPRLTAPPIAAQPRETAPPPAPRAELETAEVTSP